MAEVSQYTFSWSEVTEALIKKQNIHEGKWMAVIEFAVTGGVVGQEPPDARPGLVAMANSIQLVRAQPTSAAHLVIDASQVNPQQPAHGVANR
jgi:hypothetical protein